MRRMSCTKVDPSAECLHVHLEQRPYFHLPHGNQLLFAAGSDGVQPSMQDIERSLFVFFVSEKAPFDDSGLFEFPAVAG